MSAILSAVTLSATVELTATDIKAIKSVLTAVPRKTHKPILYGVLVTVAQDSITFTATDLTVYVSRTVSTTVWGDDVTTVVPSHVFMDMKAVKGKTVRLTVTPNSATVDGVTVPTHDAREYPLPPTVGDTVYTAILDATRYLTDFSACATFAATSESRPILRAVHHIGGIIEATDSHKLLRCETGKDFPSLNVPSDISGVLSKVFDGMKVVNMTCDQYLTQYQAADATIIVRLMEGQYPDVSRVIPQLCSASCTIDVGAVLPNIEQAYKTVRREEYCPVRWTFADNTLTAKAQDGTAFTGTIGAVWDVKPDYASICLNSGFLLTALKALDGTVDVFFNGINQALKVQQCDRVGQSDRTIIIMPVRDLTR